MTVSAFKQLSWAAGQLSPKCATTLTFSFLLILLLTLAQPALSQRNYTLNGAPVSENQYQAAGLINNSVDLLQQNRNQEAVDILLQAEKLAPNQANVHTNLGIGLAKLGRNQEALKELETARSIDPTAPNTLLSLAGLYQSQGQVANAIATYSDFVARFPQHKDAAKVSALVSGLKKEVDSGFIRPEPVASTGAPSDNYLGELGRRAQRWPANRVPIDVYIAPASLVSGYKKQYLTILKQSFAAWQEASQGDLSFNFVSTPSQAMLHVSFTDDPSSFENRAEQGETELFVDSKGFAKGTVKILTVPLTSEIPVTENRLRFICLHEIGHAVGFGGHTSNPQDIMFYSTSLSDAFPHLSPRDANSVRNLYAQ